jgi:hypothetical protein
VPGFIGQLIPRTTAASGANFSMFQLFMCSPTAQVIRHVLGYWS